MSGKPLGIGERPIPGTTAQVAALPALALSQPRAALAAADRVLAHSTDPEQRWHAHQARGIALRELRHLRRAIRELRLAADLAAELSPEHQADVSSALAIAYFMAGDSDAALAGLAAALETVSGTAAARIRVRHGYLLGMLGRPVEAARELRAASRALRRSGDFVWEIRADLNLAQAFIEIGDTARADTALQRAEDLLQGSEHTFEAAVARQDRGFVAALEGRIPDALAHYDIAEIRYREAGALPVELAESRAAALIAAGLFRDALIHADHAVTQLRRPGRSPAERAHALVQASEAALAVGNAALAGSYARQAERLFARQGRERGRTTARLALAKARHARGERTRRLAREVAQTADDAGRQHMAVAVEANLLAGELALELGDRTAADLHLRRAMRARTSRSGLTQALGWRAAALRARAAGRPRAVLTACDRGLQALDAHQLTLGAIELRVAATSHGAPLAKLALREAMLADEPVLMLRWAERWRATTFTLPPARLRGTDLSVELAQLRLLRSRISAATLEGRPVAALERDAAALEVTVRERTLRSPAAGDAAFARIDVEDLLRSMDASRLVEIFTHRNVLHVLVATNGRVRHHVAGASDVALRTADFAKFALRRMTHRAAGERARATLPAVSATLERELLGPAVAELGDDPLVIVPPAALSSTPWGVLPTLRGRAFSVAPSGASWLAARRAKPDRSHRVSLVAGPGLRHAGVEIEKTALLYPNARVLGTGGDPATASAVLAALDGAWLAHVAAHGRFRDDNPMFSSLVLEDGPLTVFDLQRLRRAPHRLVLSCCDTGAVSPAGADEMLGLLSALIPLGTAGMLAAVVPVSDAAAVGFAAVVHDRLRAGATTAEALQAARIATGDDPAAFAIAHAFVAFGAV